VAEQLQVLGVDGLQGYAIERPMALERMTQPALWPGRSALPSEGRPGLT
jgi:EAL domain-containing protein (putative c-di-GMP-specific phosphodiesterase class I)